MPDKIDLLIRTLQLATFGLGKVSPAPLMGWVLASADQTILAEGWLPHKPFSSSLLSENIESYAAPDKQNVFYINALPKITPKLLQFFSAFHIARICVAGRVEVPEKQLLLNNIFWEDDLLPEDEMFLNRRFYTHDKLHRPYIILKWAQTSDGYVARENFDSKWISTTQSRRLVHKWRAEEDAIMVGTNTAHYDNPKLNVRNWSGRDPVRIVIDKQTRLDPHLNLFDGSQPTLCYNLHIDQVRDNLTWVRIPEPENPLAFFTLMLQDLWQKKIQSVIIEGGAQLLHFLIKHQLWDEARVFTSQQQFGKGISAPALAQELISETLPVSDDLLKIYLNPKS